MGKSEFIETLSEARSLMTDLESREDIMSLEDFTRCWRKFVEDVPYISSMSGREMTVYYANISKHYHFYQCLVKMKKG